MTKENKEDLYVCNEYPVEIRNALAQSADYFEQKKVSKPSDNESKTQ